MITIVIFVIQTGLTSLHAASFKGHKAIVELLLDNGADIDIQDKVIILRIV